MAEEVVFGAIELIKVFEKMPPILQKKYMKTLVGKISAEVRKTAKKNAPSGKRTGTTDMQSAKIRGKHLPLKRHIRNGKYKTKRGEIRRSVFGPPQINPLLSGHRLIAWGRDTGKSVEPANPFMDEARLAHENDMNTEGFRLLQEAINKDFKRLGDQQARQVLTKAGARRLTAIEATGLV